MEKHKKRFVLLLLLLTLSLLLCGCGESDSAKLNRLTKEADQKKREAQEAKDNYNTIKNYVDNYGGK